MSKLCSFCGTQMNDTAGFCSKCGRKNETIGGQALKKTATTERHIQASEGFVFDATGRYHWYYEMNMFTNPTLLITLYKVFGGIVFGCGLGLGLLIWASSGKLTTAWGVIKGFGVTGIVILVLVAISYLIYAAIQGGKYCVVFEMDAKRVTHIQLAKQFKKAQVIAELTALVGVMKGSPTMIGTGLLMGSRNVMNTDFKIVNRIKVKRRRNAIYLREYMSWNHIYVQKENFDTVLSYILEQIPKEAKRKGIRTN